MATVCIVDVEVLISVAGLAAFEDGRDEVMD